MRMERTNKTTTNKICRSIMKAIILIPLGWPLLIVNYNAYPSNKISSETKQLLYPATTIPHEVFPAVGNL